MTDVLRAPHALEYTYTRSVPVKGYGAILPPLLDEWYGEGRDVLVARRGDRYYVYLTAATTAATASPSAASEA